jgi:hypothetical protein
MFSGAMASPRKASERDSQRSKVYRAEHTIWPEPGEISVEDAAKWVNSIRKSEWAKSHLPGYTTSRPITVQRGRGCHANNHTITLSPSWGTRRYIVLHELAHIIRSREEAFKGGPRPAPHGREWAMVFRALVRRFMGVQAEANLVAAWKLAGVKYLPKRKQSPSQRKGNPAALAAARAKQAEKRAERQALIARYIAGDNEAGHLLTRAEWKRAFAERERLEEVKEKHEWFAELLAAGGIPGTSKEQREFWRWKQERAQQQIAACE